MTKNRKRAAGKRKLVYKADPTSVAVVSQHLNPFDDAAKDVKIPDSNTANTFTYQVRERRTLSVNTAGAAYAEIYPSLNSIYNATVGNSNINPAADGTLAADQGNWENITNYTNVIAAIDRYRVVSFGVRITNAQPALSAQGQVILREIDQRMSLNSVSGTAPGVFGYTTVTEVVPVFTGMDYVSLPSHYGEAQYEFVPADTAWTTLDADIASQPGFKALSISVAGGPTGTAQNPVLFVEIVMNVECIPVTNSLQARLATRPADHNIHHLQAVNNARNSLPLVHKTTSLWGKIKTFAANALMDVGTRFLGKTGGQIVRTLENAVGLKPSVKMLGY
jgi:hypothetical protein